jgi:phenylpropionate dioxygenase-like ring-hydroxylating dioxygenase large terminal subunit
VFGSIAPDGVSLDEHLGAAKDQIDLFVDLSPEGKLDVRSGVSKYSYPGNWKLQVENAIDGYHPNLVHQSIFEVIRKRTKAGLDVFNGNSIGETRDLGNGHVMLDYRRYNRATTRGPRVLPTISGRGPEYVDSMVRHYGAERAEELIIAGGTHLLVFPNLILIGVQIRVVQPVSTDYTEVYLYPTLLKGVVPAMNVARLRGHEGFYGPAGGVAPDDIEMFARVQEGLHAEVDPWLLFSRGLHRERRDADGSTVGQMTDEVPQRGIWSHWKKVMTGETELPHHQADVRRVAAVD